MLEFYRARQLGDGDQLARQSDAQILAATVQWFRHLDPDRFEQWRKACKHFLKTCEISTPQQRGKLRQALDIHLRWAKIEPEVQSPYTWAAFTLSGGFF